MRVRLKRMGEQKFAWIAPAFRRPLMTLSMLLRIYGKSRVHRRESALPRSNPAISLFAKNFRYSEPGISPRLSSTNRLSFSAVG